MRRYILTDKFILTDADCHFEAAVSSSLKLSREEWFGHMNLVLFQVSGDDNNKLELPETKRNL